MTNTITVTGRLARDPELKFSRNGKAMCSVSVPDQKRTRNRDTNEWENASATTWFRATVFEEAAEQLAETARKGDTVVLTGRLITREWTGDDGQVRSSLEIDYATVAVVPGAPKAQRGTQQPDQWASQPQQQTWGGAGNGDTEPPF